MTKGVESIFLSSPSATSSVPSPHHLGYWYLDPFPCYKLGATCRSHAKKQQLGDLMLTSLPLQTSPFPGSI